MDNQSIRPPFFTASPYRTFRALTRATPALDDKGFPRDETFIEFEGSTITIPMRTIELVEEDGVFVETHRTDEILRLKAFMRLEVYPAYMNQQGTREFQFIIRDWELYEQSRSLNKLCKGDFDGRAALTTHTNPADRVHYRQTVGVTFSLSKTYIKYRDNGNAALAPVEEEPQMSGTPTPILVINNMANQWNRHNSITWQLREAPAGSGSFHVDFYRLPFESGRLYDPVANRLDLVATTQNMADPNEAGVVTANGEFTARGLPDPDFPPNPKRPPPLLILWKLGSAPANNAQGFLHEVSPPQSFCVADYGPAPGQPEDSSDFPARITYSASYNVFLNNVQIICDQAGVAMARNVLQIPPRDVLVAFEKPFAGELDVPDDGDRRTPRRRIRIEFGSGTCTGMVEISQSDWERGKAMALSAQGEERALTAFGATFDPNRPVSLF